MSKIIIVTGGTGYVGSRVVKQLSEKGYTVVAVDCATPEERGIQLPSDVEFRQADLRSHQAALQVLHGADVLVHLAADMGSMTYMREHKADIIKNNAAMDAAIYPAIQELGIPWIIYSSSSMVFQHPPHFPYKESDLRDIKPPTNTYGFSKLAGEYFCRAYAEQYGINFTILRYHNIYGAGEDTKGATPGDIHVIPALLEKVFKGQYPLEFLGDDPEIATRPFVYVDDAVNATVAVIEKAALSDEIVKNEDYNIGNDKYYTILELGKIIWQRYGDGREFKYTTVPTQQDTALRREVDITKIKNTLGWSPETTLEEGLEQTAEWIKTRNT